MKRHHLYYQMRKYGFDEIKGISRNLGNIIQTNFENLDGNLLEDWMLARIKYKVFHFHKFLIL